MAESEDLRVTGVACSEDPSESVENKANQSRKQGHERRRLTASPMPKTHGITARMNLRSLFVVKGVFEVCWGALG